MRLTTPLVWEEYYRESYSAETPIGNFYMEPATNFLEDTEKEWAVFFGGFDTEIGAAKSQEEATRVAENWLFATIKNSVVFEISDT